MMEIIKAARELIALMEKQPFDVYHAQSIPTKLLIDAIYCSLRKLVGNPL